MDKENKRFKKVIVAIKYKTISRSKYNAMKKLGYTSKGSDGILRGMFLTSRGTSLIPIKIRKTRKK